MEFDRLEHITVTVGQPQTPGVPHQSASQIQAEIDRFERGGQENRAQREAELQRAVDLGMAQEHISHLVSRDRRIDQLHLQQLADMRAQLKLRMDYEQRLAQVDQQKQAEAATALEAAEKARAEKIWVDNGGDRREFESLWPELYKRILRNKVIEQVQQMDTSRVAQMKMLLDDF